MINIRSEFERHSDAIVLAAGQIYRAHKEGLEPDPDASRVALAYNLGDLSVGAVYEAERAEAQLNVGARALSRMAILTDQKEGGGIMGVVARLEIGLSRITERKYLKDAFTPGGPLDRVRGVTNSD